MLRGRVLVVALVVGLSACGWAQYRGDAAHTGYQPIESTIGVANVAGLTESWSTPNADASGVVAGTTLFAPSVGGLLALDAAGVNGCGGTPKTCAPLWTGRVPSGTSFVSTPAVANGIVYVDVGNATLLAFDAAGVNGCSGAPKVCTPLWSATIRAHGVLRVPDRRERCRLRRRQQRESVRIRRCGRHRLLRRAQDVRPAVEGVEPERRRGNPDGGERDRIHRRDPRDLGLRRVGSDRVLGDAEDVCAALDRDGSGPDLDDGRGRRRPLRERTRVHHRGRARRLRRGWDRRLFGRPEDLRAAVDGDDHRFPRQSRRRVGRGLRHHARREAARLRREGRAGVLGVAEDLRAAVDGRPPCERGMVPFGRERRDLRADVQQAAGVRRDRHGMSRDPRRLPAAVRLAAVRRRAGRSGRRERNGLRVLAERRAARPASPAS